ncbi:MAG: ubiquinone biosynthesis protein UbiA [Flavobacteriaceae bacterium CG_4_8_14_3_um_filter_34_10]|nr:UbiA family prenyltransferase [Flavobacteriia bacterium]OIP50904.1 MAG: ubiquinone biosynthesis protein UbiA [Flavobacteriaceae bacterium CG2_30_34_30]PIQ17441.1 MAG: ubiquinone biosynthesis protein UbiA [Flavobacteriaceae bacterium CG18_big_fil_WC_8_21_14_2_50_34_36]PIV48678.1 MAG: ubiquinone biosynthesis protein UbiA [Flavobacteriaceae bacterium CG02_land_8_20_14_3_00_34_13]PIX09074.1 MAG: ubiquinone biosynthesis protein UbiA [Flavobacteriaceae bacterium CG_4_8_14_3_um_filter_34_10]PIZ075
MSLISHKQKIFLLKFLSLISVVRGYNILIIVIAQYLTSIYILAPEKSLLEVVLDPNLFVIVLASSLVIASGYIINNFYDAEKDLINRPTKTYLDSFISQNTKLSVYFVLNFLSVILASYISFRAVLFFSVYIFFIWLYSHKLKKYPFIGNLTASILAIIPFFAVFIYYKNFALVIFVHATFLFLIISMRELVKDLENIKGDFTLGYQTIPVVYGEKTSKFILTFLSVLTLIPTFLLINKFEIGYMNFFFYGSLLLLVIFLFYLWMSSQKLHYIILHNILKLIIVLGVFSIILIDVDFLLRRIL